MKTHTSKQNIQVVILCGGENPKEFGTKPKYLYHINGRQRLTDTFESLATIGIASSNVRLLLGEFADYTRKTLEDKGLYPEIVVNNHHEKSAVFSFKIAFEGLNKQTGSVLLLQGDEYYAPEMLRQITMAKGDLIYFYKAPMKNCANTLAPNIFRCSTEFIDYFSDDIYLTSDFYSADPNIFQSYYDYTGDLTPNQLPCKIHTGYAMGFMMFHAIERISAKFPERCTFLPDHGLYMPDLDSIIQTDEFRNKTLLVRYCILVKRRIRILLVPQLQKLPVIYSLLWNIKKKLGK